MARPIIFYRAFCLQYTSLCKFQCQLTVSTVTSQQSPQLIYLIACTSYLFADDTKCLKVISNPTDIQISQEDLDNLSNWSHTNKLLFNESKSTHLHFENNFGLDTYALIGSDIATTDCINIRI